MRNPLLQAAQKDLRRMHAATAADEIARLKTKLAKAEMERDLERLYNHPVNEGP
jgi:hypothetical protein